MDADYLIIGSGIAALRAAAALDGAGRVLVLTKAGPRAGNTGYAQGGIAAAVGADDSPARHLTDTMAAGDGLCDRAAVSVLVEEGPRYVRELIDWGAAFDRGPDGQPELALEAAHSARRVLHASDATGREIGRALWERVSRIANVRIQSHARVVSLILESEQCVGVEFLRDDGTRGSARAPCTLLATGGTGQVFSETTNPPVATGDGVAMAYRAGAAVADLEFVQFHPTALKMPGQPRFLLSEALRGEGARLVNGAGEAFMTRYDPAGDLAPRDRVARGIVREAQRSGGGIFLTLEGLDPAFVHARFPLISDTCRRAGLDLATDRIPVGPAAHYAMGGVVADVDGRTTVPALFAAGEVACTGVHGANRLASNSLLEGLVFGARAGIAMRASPATAFRLKAETSSYEEFRLKAETSSDVEFRLKAETSSDVEFRLKAETTEGAEQSASVEISVASAFRRKEQSASVETSVASAFRRKEQSAEDARRLMWEHAGLFRTGDGLRAALAGLGPPRPDEESVVTVGRLIARAALRRDESRGAHFRLDFPERNDSRWTRRIMETVD